MNDPTNANAEPGPSSKPFVPDSHTPATVTAAPAASSSYSSAEASAPKPTTIVAPAKDQQQPPITSRPPNAPSIVPTIDLPDGTKQVPALFELCEPEDLITLISSMLDRLISHNDRIPLTPTSLTRFHSRAPPSITVRDYLLRIARYTNVESVCLLILLHYVDKVCARMPTFTISSLTVHRFIIAAISVGSKALSDSFCTNGRYARVGGVSIAEMNLLEKEFCEAIDWRLTTTGTTLAHYYTSLVRSHPSYQLPPTPIRPKSTHRTSSPGTIPTSVSSSDVSMSDRGDGEEQDDDESESMDVVDSPVAPIKRQWGSSSTDASGEIFIETAASAAAGGGGPDGSPRGRAPRPSPALIPPNWLPNTRPATASHLPSPVRPASMSHPSHPPPVSGEMLGNALQALQGNSSTTSPPPRTNGSPALVPSASPPLSNTARPSSISSYHSPPLPSATSSSRTFGSPLGRKVIPGTGGTRDESRSPSTTRRKASKLNPGSSSPHDTWNASSGSPTSNGFAGVAATTAAAGKDQKRSPNGTGVGV
ncbi:cyclin-domain-containing protein [Meredithblackwellia eburnea MCA 4105]